MGHGRRALEGLGLEVELEQVGAQRFVLCLGFRSWLIKEYFLRYREQIADVTVRLGDPAPPVCLLYTSPSPRDRS